MRTEEKLRQLRQSINAQETRMLQAILPKLYAKQRDRTSLLHETLDRRIGSKR